MRKLTLFSAVLIILFVLTNTGQAGNNLTISYSPMNITQAMDLELKSNSLNYLYTQEPLVNDTTFAKANESKPGKLKSPVVALVIAVVPGIVVHGAGHFYAGKTKTAIGLFGAEILGAGLTGLGLLGSLRGDTGGEGSYGGEVVIALGLGFFFGSWIYDIVESPSVIKRQNDQTPEKKPFPYDLDMKLEKEDQQIKCLLVKRF